MVFNAKLSRDLISTCTLRYRGFFFFFLLSFGWTGFFLCQTELRQLGCDWNDSTLHQCVPYILNLPPPQGSARPHVLCLKHEGKSRCKNVYVKVKETEDAHAVRQLEVDRFFLNTTDPVRCPAYVQEDKWTGFSKPDTPAGMISKSVLICFTCPSAEERIKVWNGEEAP